MLLSHRLERLHAALISGDGEKPITDLVPDRGIVDFARYPRHIRSFTAAALLTSYAAAESSDTSFGKSSG